MPCFLDRALHGTFYPHANRRQEMARRGGPERSGARRLAASARAHHKRLRAKDAVRSEFSRRKLRDLRFTYRASLADPLARVGAQPAGRWFQRPADYRTTD